MYTFGGMCLTYFSILRNEEHVNTKKSPHPYIGSTLFVPIVRPFSVEDFDFWTLFTLWLRLSYNGMWPKDEYSNTSET